jgi:hypothetical protein
MLTVHRLTLVGMNLDSAKISSSLCGCPVSATWVCRPRSTPPARRSTLGRAGSVQLAGDNALLQPPSLTFAVQRHGASRGGETTSMSAATAQDTTLPSYNSAGGVVNGIGAGLRANTRVSIVPKPSVPLLDTRRGGRSDSGPDLAGAAAMADAAQQAGHAGVYGDIQQGTYQVPEVSPGKEWRSWQAWGRQWWVRPDPLAAKSARSGACRHLVKKSNIASNLICF